jgi:hypothetical protein
MRARLLLPLALAATIARPAMAAPKAELWPRWQTHDPASTVTIDHGTYGDLLQRYVSGHPDGINRVRYAALKTNDREALEHYIRTLETVDPDRLGRAEQMAYWVNFYNALTLLVVVEHYPVQSIREINISPGLFSRGPWGRKLITVNSVALSLDDIEHRILRPIWQDPRIHYAVNCASIGCPNLQLEPFTARRLDALLDRGARDYVNHPRGIARVVRSFAADRLTASSIYDWFQADFGGSEAGVLDHLRVYADSATTQLLADVESIDAYRYDWALNDSDS